jgi:hypothetical protein
VRRLLGRRLGGPNILRDRGKGVTGKRARGKGVRHGEKGSGTDSAFRFLSPFLPSEEKDLKGRIIAGTGAIAPYSFSLSGFLIPVGMLLLIELEPAFTVPFLVGILLHGIGLLLPFGRRLEVARFGVGSGQ